MSLPIKAVDRIFSRLAATYGAAWERSMGSAPLGDVQAIWAHELAGFAGHLQSIAWALEHLPEVCPNVLVFKRLCRAAPREDAPALAAPVADPQRLREELARLSDVRRAQVAGPVERKGWARRIVARFLAGGGVSPTSLGMALGALHLPVRAGDGQRDAWLALLRAEVQA